MVCCMITMKRRLRAYINSLSPICTQITNTQVRIHTFILNQPQEKEGQVNQQAVVEEQGMRKTTVQRWKHKIHTQT